MGYYLGIDVGSVSTDLVIIDENNNVCDELYLKTKGNPIKALKEGFKIFKENYIDEKIYGVGTTGSGRQIAAFIAGSDIIKNEITAHAVAAIQMDKEIKTIIEIGGQDSKIIIIRDGIVVDFAMNTVCAAGTGSFLDRQAERLEIPIEKFGDLAVSSVNPVRIAGRCAVFAESDMIHKQQLGYSNSDIVKGLCEALVRNYLNNVGKGKEILSKTFFQGGVAANKGMKSAFEDELGYELMIPKYYNVMGAIGSAILAKEKISKGYKTKFKGFDIEDINFSSTSNNCTNCGNNCEIVRIKEDNVILGCFGDRCGKYSNRIII